MLTQAPLSGRQRPPGPPSAPASAGALEAIVAALRTERDRIEASFVDVGSALSGAYSEITALTEGFAFVPGLVQRDELAEAARALRATMDVGTDISSAFKDKETLIGEIERVLGNVHASLRTLNRAARSLSILVINARIDVSYLDDRPRIVEFFDKHFANSSEELSYIVRDVARHCRALAKNIAEINASIVAFNENEAPNIKALASSVSQQLDAIERRRDVIAEHAPQVTQLSQTISQQICAIIASLQVGDATRQRIEHICDGIEDLIAAPRTPCGTLLPVLAAQAEDLARRFEADVAQLAVALDGVTSDARAAVDVAVSVEAAVAIGSDDTALSRDFATIERLLVGILDSYEKLGTAVQTTVADAETTFEATRSIDELQGKIRMLSFNATICALSTGEKKGSLTAVANEIRRLAESVAHAAKITMGALEAFTSRAQDLDVTKSGVSAQAVKSRLGKTGEAGRLIRENDRQIAEATGRLSPLLDRLKVEIGGAHAARALQREVAQRLEQIAKSLRSVAGPTPPAPSPDASEQRLIDAIRARYTMRAERDVHDHVVAGKPGLPAPVNHADDTPSDAGEHTDVVLF